MADTHYKTEWTKTVRANTKSRLFVRLVFAFTIGFEIISSAGGYMHFFIFMASAAIAFMVTILTHPSWDLLADEHKGKPIHIRFADGKAIIERPNKTRRIPAWMLRIKEEDGKTVAVIPFPISLFFFYSKYPRLEIVEPSDTDTPKISDNPSE